MLNRAALQDLKPYRNWSSLTTMAALMGGSGLLAGAWFDSHYVLPGHSIFQHVLAALQEPKGYLAWCNPWLGRIIAFWLVPLNLTGIGVYGAWLWFGQLINPVRHVKGRRLLRGKEAIAASRQASHEALEISKGKIGLAFSKDFILSRPAMLKSILAIGAQGSGKTVFLNGALKSAIAENHKLIIFDPVKADFSGWVPMSSKLKSGKEKLLLLGASDSRSFHWWLGYDLLEECDAIAFSNGCVEDSSDPMWANSARQVLTGLIVHLQKTRGRNWSWPELADLIYQSIEDSGAILEESYKPAAGFFAGGRESRTASSIDTNLKAFVSFFGRQAETCKRINGKRFSFREWLLDDNTPDRRIIVQMDQRDKVLGAGVSRALLSFIATTISGLEFPESKTRVLGLYVDEAVQFGKLDLTQFNAVGRSKGIYVVAAAQDFSQLERIYGKAGLVEWMALFSIKIYPQVVGGMSQKLAVDDIGNRVVQYRTKSVSGTGNGKASVSSSWSQPTEEPVILPSELADFGLRKNGIEALVVGHGRNALALTFPFPDKPKIKFITHFPFFIRQKSELARLPHVPWPKLTAPTLPVAATTTLPVDHEELEHHQAFGLVDHAIQDEQETVDGRVDDLSSTILAMFNEIVPEPALELEITDASATREQPVGDPWDNMKASQEAQAEYIPIEAGSKQRKRRMYKRQEDSFC